MEVEKRIITSLEKDGTYLDMRKRSIKDMIDGNWNLTNQTEEETISYLNGINNFYSLKGADFVLFYDTLESRDEAQKLFGANFKYKGIWAEEKEDGTHFPRVIGAFDYNGKLGLWVEGLNPLNDITNENIGVYKGVILNPKKYLEVNETLLSTTGKVDSIIK